jgi:NADH-quinone oxidoreductase subunit L
MNTNLLYLLLAPFIGFLFNVFFGKASENQLLESLELLLFSLLFLASHFFGQLNPAGPNFTFRLDSAISR